jgi:hypothetical protein
MSTGLFDGGGRGMSGSAGLGMISSTVICPALNPILSSAFVWVVVVAMVFL